MTASPSLWPLHTLTRAEGRHTLRTHHYQTHKHTHTRDLLTPTKPIWPHTPLHQFTSAYTCVYVGSRVRVRVTVVFPLWGHMRAWSRSYQMHLFLYNPLAAYIFRSKFLQRLALIIHVWWQIHRLSLSRRLRVCVCVFWRAWLMVCENYCSTILLH